MKILVVGDFTSQPCGIRNYLDQTYTALARHPGLDVSKWDGHYPEVYRRREAGEPTYLPEDAASYDVIHVVWHPIAFNTYGAEHFPPAQEYVSYEVEVANGRTVQRSVRHIRKPLLSVYLTDIPPWSGCPFAERADVRFAAEVSPGCVVLPYPVADWVMLPPADRDFSVGCSTVRGDGVQQVQEVCDARGWELRLPNHARGWLTFEEEVQRMARNTVNVLWYREGRGKSGGLSQAISAGRPIVCSNSPIFSHFFDYADELYIDRDVQPGRLEDFLDEVYQHWTQGALRYPRRAAEEMSWSTATARMVDAWEQARSC